MSKRIFVARKIFSLFSALSLFLPAAAQAQQATVRLDPPSITVTIDAAGNIHGDGPVNLYVSHKDSGPFCSKASVANISLEDIPGGGDSSYGQYTYDFSVPSTGPGAGHMLTLPANPPYNINFKQSGGMLCNLNESDMTPYPYVITPITIY